MGGTPQSLIQIADGMRFGIEEGSYLRLIDFVYHSTLGLRVIKKKIPQHLIQTADGLRFGIRDLLLASSSLLLYYSQA